MPYRQHLAPNNGLEAFDGKKAREPLLAKSGWANKRADGSSSQKVCWYPLNTDRWRSPGADDNPLHQTWSALPSWSLVNSAQPSTLPRWSPLSSTQPSTLPSWSPLNSTQPRQLCPAGARPMQPWSVWCPALHHHSWVVCSGTPVETTSPVRPASSSPTVSTHLSLLDLEGSYGSWSTGAPFWSSLQCHHHVH